MIRKLCFLLFVSLCIGQLGFGQVPVASIVASPMSGCPPLAVAFNGSGTNNPTGWSWSFPGGSPAGSTAQNIAVIYNTPGTYTASLTASNASGNSQTVTVSITVNPIPIADFSLDRTTGCYPTVIHFNDASTPGAGATITSRTWNWGDGSQDFNVLNPSHKYTYADTFNVILYVTNNFNCTGKAQVKNAQQAVIISGGVQANFNTSLNSTCTLPVDATFNNTSVITGAMTYAWDFGDGGTSTGFSPVHPYSAAGNYNVRLAVGSNLGCADTLTLPVNITASGNISDFTAPDSVCVNTVVNFKNTSSPQPITANWDYGVAGGTSNGLNGSFTYTTPGKYTVTLTNTFPGCGGFKTKDIYVMLPPTADFSGTNLIGCKAPLNTTFTNLSTGATSWLWDFGDGTMYSGQTPPAHPYNTFGSFTVTLQASSAPGCVSGKTQLNYVKVDSPKIVFNNLPAFGCAPFNFAPSATVTAVDGVASYNWNIAGTAYAVQNPPAQNYATGIYPVTLTVTTNGGCSTLLKDTIKVGSVKPVPNFTFTPNPDCLSAPVSYTSTSTGADQWLWKFGDGATGTGASTTHLYGAPNNYTITLIAYNQGCPDSVSKPITVNGPKADFTYSTGCGAANTYTFTDNSSGGATGWLWDFGDGTSSTAQNPPAHSYPAGPPKTYNVTLTASSAVCQDKITIPINVGQTIQLSPNVASVCMNTNFYLTASAPNPGKIVSYTFKLGNGDSVKGSSASIGYSYTVPGTYQIKVITQDINGCIDSSAAVPFTVNGSIVNFSSPTNLSCGPLNITFTNLSTTVGTPTYAWDFGDGQTSNLKNPTHQYNTQGVYVPRLTITDQAGCVASLDTAQSIVVSIMTPKYIPTYLNLEDSNFCPKTVIAFRNLSSGGFAPTYAWDFNNGATATGPSPTYTYPLVGKYYDTLIMTDYYGCVKKYSTPYYINIDTPVANFNLSSTYSSCPPLNEQFTFTGSYAAKYSWDFTDGNGATVKDPLNLYVNPGDYYPVLTVTSPGGCVAVSAPQHIHIDGPIGSLSYSPLTSCGPMTVNFVVTTNNATTITWVYGDGTKPDSSNQKTATHLYNLANQYTPFVTLTDAAGCKVNVFGASPISIDSIGKTLFVVDKNTLCDSGWVTFTDTSQLGPKTVISNYTWNFQDGTLPVSGPNGKIVPHYFTTPGVYNVQLSITTTGGCNDSYTMPITVSASPKIAINGLISQCEPAVLTFSGVETVPDPYQPLTWTWNFGNTQTGTGANPPPVSYPKAGEYVVQATATNARGCTSKTDTTKPNHLFIYPSPTVFAGADTTICLGDNLQLNATGNATSYNWLPPAVGNLSCAPPCANPLATNVTSSTIFVVNGTSINGCQTKDTINVTVNTPVTITASGIDSVCLGQSTQLNASGGAIYNWSPATGLSDPNIANPVATPIASQIGGGNSAILTYTVTGYDNKKCFSNTDSVQITAFNYPVVNAGADATINVGASYQINATTTGNIVSLNWQPANNLSCTNCLTPVANPSKTTTYALTAINDGGCPTTDTIRIQVICNGANFFVPNSFSPNGDGVNDYFIINGTGLNVIPSITIYNRWGQIVFQKSNFAANSASEAWDGRFNGQPAPPDVYIYTLQILCNNATLIPYHGNVTLIR